MPSDAETYVKHLQNIFGEEDAIHKANAKDGGPPIAIFVYQDIPEPGMITGVTYVLSLCPLPAWKLARPEMILSVASNLIDWPMAAATFTALFRGAKRFQYGDIFMTDDPLAPDTEMTGFLIFAQSILEDDVASLHLSKYKIHFSQFYPIHKEEVAINDRIGLEAFWKHSDYDMYDVTRKPIRA
jgi:hypothetical protein